MLTRVSADIFIEMLNKVLEDVLKNKNTSVKFYLILSDWLENSKTHFKTSSRIKNFLTLLQKINSLILIDPTYWLKDSNDIINLLINGYFQSNLKCHSHQNLFRFELFLIKSDDDPY